MDNAELRGICDQLRWSAFRLGTVFKLHPVDARMMFEGTMPVDEEIASYLRRIADLVDSAPTSVRRMPRLPEKYGDMIGRLIVAMVDIQRLDAYGGAQTTQWLDQLETLIKSVPDKSAPTTALGMALADHPMATPAGGT